MKNTKIIVLGVVVLVIAALMVFIDNPSEREVWDAKVSELCVQDGGVQVFQVVHLTEQEYQELGGDGGMIDIPIEIPSNRPEAPYVIRFESSVLNAANPEVLRDRYAIVRTEDDLELGVFVNYLRRGGETVSLPMESSRFSCADLPGFESDLESRVFMFQ